MKSGWIKLHRKFTNWEWYDDNNVKVVFLHCLFRANYEVKKYRGETIKRGQFITGRSKFANQVGLSVQQVRTAWEKLESTGEITIKTTSKGTWITVCNYCTYQDTGDGSNQQTNHQVTSEQPSNNHQITTSKKYNNKKNNKKNKKYTREFEDFWDLYDLKKGKKRAWLEWKKLTSKEHELIMENVPVFLTHFSSKQYTPRPRKYLYNRYWEDEDYQQPQIEDHGKRNGSPVRKTKGDRRIESLKSYLN